ncbi:MAG: outer membrane beta-barrel protein, partial [Rhodospirillales bacterium]|nr:outer membrane beta-barrel protein [Rhodospirillales bacterium]
LVGRVRAKASLSDYQGTARKDYTYTGNAGFKYLLNRNLWAGLEYQYKSKDSNQAGNDVVSQKYLANIGAQF